ncbi:MAG: DNA polymerase III subunit beta [Hydrogenophilales bacterium CG_4_10_14_3_um_filter_58_23]|nr:MAG: DNA polymerase III subunit beta [Hydrogenophilales bacterium CG18_big_fil_WC_8_21_14_2_50_58_12]PIX98470.1 MAG: DNA polymerase III subunit beta [Hydrogenophilales bacterium CG_4_10_14_3_um_filter_58_23]
MLLIQTNRDALLKPLQSVIGIVERRHTIPILSNILIEKTGENLSIVATDLEIQITATSICQDELPDFSITTSAKKLQDICRAFPESSQISLEKDDSRLQIKVGKSQFNLQTLPSNDFPKLVPSGENRYCLKTTQKTLKYLLNLVQYAMAQQDIRYYLNGLLLVVESKLLRVVATDGHRLGMACSPLENIEDTEERSPQEVILPRKTVIELIKLLSDKDEEVTIEISQNQTRFSFANIILVSKIVEGRFPDYNRVIPADYQNHIQIDRILFLQSLQRASILSNEKFRGVRLVLTQNSLRTICNNSEQEEAQEEIEVSYTGEPLDIGFNVNYLLDVLTNLNNNSITLSFGDANSSGLFTIPGNEYFKYVVMPMRI